MEVSEVLREGMVVVLKIAAPLLVLSMIMGIIIAIFQAVTQIHEQSLAFILKALVVVGALVIGGSWMMQNLIDYCLMLFTLM